MPHDRTEDVTSSMRACQMRSHLYDKDLWAEMGPGTEVPEQLVANSNTWAPYSGDSAFRVERATVPRGAEVVVCLRSSILVVVPQRVS